MKKILVLFSILQYSIVTFALNIRNEDLKQSLFGDLLDSIIIVVVIVSISVWFFVRGIKVLFRIKQTAKVTIPIATNLDYLKYWYRCKRIADNAYVTLTNAEIEAEEALFELRESGRISFLYEGATYYIKGLNIFSDYVAIRIENDNHIFYMKKE